MPTLFEISEDMFAMKDLLLDNEGEMTPEEEEIVNAWFAEVENDEETKIDNYCALVKELLLLAKTKAAVAKTVAEEAARLKATANAYENKADKLKERMKLYFTLHGIEKFQAPRFRAMVCTNGGVQKVEIEVDPADLAPHHQNVEIKANTDAIRKDLLSGREVPGCTLAPRGTHLRIA